MKEERNFNNNASKLVDDGYRGSRRVEDSLRKVPTDSTNRALGKLALYGTIATGIFGGILFVREKFRDIKRLDYNNNEGRYSAEEARAHKIREHVRTAEDLVNRGNNSNINKKRF